MKLTSNEKQQIFFDSFDMFKNDWEKNSDTLTRSIAEVATFDVEAAIQMWIYILEKNPKSINTDSNITGGILKALPEDAYDAVANNAFIKNSLYLKSSEPWESIELITYFLKNADFYAANELFDIILQNKNTAEYNYSDFKSSNISTCLYYTLDRLYNFNEDDIDFLSDWIERIDDVNEKMKLKVLLLSKEEKAGAIIGYNSSRSQKKNNYLLEDASLEDLELASSNREKFEIKKLIESICSRSVSAIDFSKLDISWLNRVFENSQGYSEDNFNIIGAYYAINSMSWDTQRLVKSIYQERVKIESLWKNSYTGDTEFSIKQKLIYIQRSIDEMAHRWNFSKMVDFSNSIINLYESYTEYVNAINSIRDQELQKYRDVSIDTTVLTTRVRNILIKNGITDISSLVKLIDSGVHLEGLGDKSIADICDKISKLGITVNANSVNDDLDYILNYYHIQANTNQANATHEITRLLGIDQQTLGWGLSRSKLIDYLKDQVSIAKNFLVNYSVSSGLLENMLLLRKDDTTIFVPGKYFYTSISTTSFLRNYY